MPYERSCSIKFNQFVINEVDCLVALCSNLPWCLCCLCQRYVIMIISRTINTIFHYIGSCAMLDVKGDEGGKDAGGGCRSDGFVVVTS